MIAVERTRYVFPGGHLSPSQINEYRDCPRCYEMNRILRVPRPDTIHYAIGAGLHRAAELIGKRVLAAAATPPLEELETVAAGEFTERTEVSVDAESGTELLLDMGKYGSVGEALDETVRLCYVLHERLPKLFKARRLVAVEMDMAEIPDDIRALAYPFSMKGRLDHVYGYEDSEGVVIEGVSDLKSSSKRGGPDENGALQFAMYGLPAHMAGARWRIGSDVLVKTITPQFETYWANGDGLITAEQYATVRGIVLDVADRITCGDFPIGKGWNGRHNYEHGMPRFSIAVSGLAS